MKYIIVWGNLSDGFEFIGPFDKHSDALDYAQSDREIRNSDYSIILLLEPAK